MRLQAAAQRQGVRQNRLHPSTFLHDSHLIRFSNSTTMTNPRQRGIVLLSVLVDPALALIAVYTTYLGEEGHWSWFFAVSALALLLLVGSKIFQAYPQIQQLVFRESLEARIANSMIPLRISNFYAMQDPAEQDTRNADTRRAIETAERMWLCANSGASYLDPAVYRHWPSVEKRLRDGIEFRVVLLDPASDEKDFRSLQNVNGTPIDSKLNLSNLVELSNRYPTLEIRMVSTGMTLTVFATDSTLFLDPYHVGTVNGRIESRTFCVQLEGSPGESPETLYRVYKSHFDALWRASTPLGTWLGRQPAESVGNLQPLHSTIKG